MSADIYAGVKRTALVSPCGAYRYWLRRQWPDGDGKVVCFVMLNPSTADGDVDDPTLRRCMGFARQWGFSTLSVRNLYALRSTNPANLLTHRDPIGPSGDAELAAAASADLVVCGWGTGVKGTLSRSADAVRLMRGKPLHCLGFTLSGSPRHPLYVPKAAELVAYSGGG